MIPALTDEGPAFVKPEELERWGKEFIKRHRRHASQRLLDRDAPLSTNLKGLAGEAALVKWLNRHSEEPSFSLDLTTRLEGDSGIDQSLHYYVEGKLILTTTIDIKTGDNNKGRARFLLVEQKPKHPSIYVMAHYYTPSRTKLVGWQWSSAIVGGYPAKKWPYSVINHCVPIEDLRPMKELLPLIKWELRIPGTAMSSHESRALS